MNGLLVNLHAAMKGNKVDFFHELGRLAIAPDQIERIRAVVDGSGGRKPTGGRPGELLRR